MGEEEYAGEAPLLMSYHRQFYALGEHYNSIVPVGGGWKGGEEEEEERGREGRN